MKDPDSPDSIFQSEFCRDDRSHRFTPFVVLYTEAVVSFPVVVAALIATEMRHGTSHETHETTTVAPKTEIHVKLLTL